MSRESDYPSSSKCHQGGKQGFSGGPEGEVNSAWRTAPGWRGSYWRIPEVTSQFSGLILIKVCLSLASRVLLTRATVLWVPSPRCPPVPRWPLHSLQPIPWHDTDIFRPFSQEFI